MIKQQVDIKMVLQLIEDQYVLLIKIQGIIWCNIILGGYLYCYFCLFQAVKQYFIAHSSSIIRETLMYTSLICLILVVY
ncbi:hypothetical protein IMG5_169790, partial [Ichthyophthirius multifiliis]